MTSCFVCIMTLYFQLRFLIGIGLVFIVLEYLDIIMYISGQNTFEQSAVQYKSGQNSVQNKSGQNSMQSKDVQRQIYHVHSFGKTDFQRVTDDNSILVYSAYLEESENRLRVIGVTKMENNSQILCILRYKLTKQVVVVEGYIEHIPESHGLRYTAAFFLCKFTDAALPDEVSVVDKSSTTDAPDTLPVNRIIDYHDKHVYTACVSPMHSKFNDSTMIIEWIELNKILGVESFTIYLNRVSKNVQRVLSYYEKRGDVTLLPWTLPRTLRVTSHRLLHYYGQLAALNDCLYRNKGRSHYITATDLDEFIIPQMPADITWSDMLYRLPRQSAYVIRSSLFSQDKACSRKRKCLNKLTIESYKHRDDLILPAHKRSKYIAKTDDVNTMGIHSPISFRTGSAYTVSPVVALLHHYRRGTKGYSSAPSNKVRHYAAIKYTRSLQRSLADVRIDLLSYSRNK